MAPASPAALTPHVFSILAAFIEEKTGLHYAPPDRDLLADKLIGRVVETGSGSFLDYYYRLRYDAEPDELTAMIDALVVGETYFFREREQMVVAVEHLVAPKNATAEKARIWSAACATGEEPFGLAMLLAERGLLEQTEVVATDLSPRHLQRATTGRYPARVLRRAADLPLLEKHSEQVGGELVLAARIRDAVRFQRFNLLDDPGAHFGDFDVILCRNVLIYFDDTTTRAVVEKLLGRLRPGGALFVGVSESLMRYGSGLSCEEHGGVFMYRSAS